MVEYTTQGTLRGTKPPASTSSVAAGSPQSATRLPTERANAELREAMIREAAFFRAEHRAFAPGGELEDWFAAEREIDVVLARRFRGAPGGR
jgi:Protein of unknown function (DUF2934)